MRDLPGECRVTIEHDPHLASVVLTDARTGVVLEDVTVDGMTRANAREVALALAPVRDTSTSGLRSGIPSRITLLELLGAREHDAEDTIRRWNEDAERTLGAPIGASGEGPLHVDLRADGPHALIAGTTGAGKSELLQTLVAVPGRPPPADPPDVPARRLQGRRGVQGVRRAAAQVGFVTDLDAHLTQRALTSLNAELKAPRAHPARRGRQGPDRLERRAGSAPPSLVIVIDEFATLAKEVPGVRRGRRRRRPARPLARCAPGARHAAPGWRRHRQHPRQHQPADRAADGGAGRERDIDRRHRRRPDRPLRARAARSPASATAELTEFQSAYVGGITMIAADGPPIELRDFGFGPPTTCRRPPAARPPTGPWRPTSRSS